MLTLFGLMERALTSEDDISFEKMFRDYLVKGDGFKRLIRSDFPDNLSHNRACAIYLVFSLKSIFEKWIYSSVCDLAKEARPEEEEQRIDETGTTFIEMMQGMVGGGINASRKTHCPAKIK